MTHSNLVWINKGYQIFIMMFSYSNANWIRLLSAFEEEIVAIPLVSFFKYPIYDLQILMIFLLENYGNNQWRIIEYLSVSIMRLCLKYFLYINVITDYSTSNKKFLKIMCFIYSWKSRTIWNIPYKGCF